MSKHTVKDFRFLGLPAELRTIVYEYLTIGMIRYSYTSFEGDHFHKCQISLSIARAGATVQLLTTCRPIYDEAKSLLLHKLAEIAHQNRTIPHFWGESKEFSDIWERHGFIPTMIEWFRALENDAHVDFEQLK